MKGRAANEGRRKEAGGQGYLTHGVAGQGSVKDETMKMLGPKNSFLERGWKTGSVGETPINCIPV